MNIFKWTERLLAFTIIILPLACGSGGTDTGNTTDDTGSEDDGGEGNFRVSGQLSTLTVSSVSALNQENSSGTVTDIVAVSPETGDTDCETQDVESDGTFEIDIEGGKPWFIYFIDETTQEFLGQIYSEEQDLDTLAPASTEGEVDLGTLTIDGETGLATSSNPLADILSDLGITELVAEVLGELDDIASRYQDPDLDDDGQMDCQTEGQSFILDFHVRYTMLVGSSHATIANIIDNFLDTDSTTFDYENTGIYLAYPTSYSSEDTGTVTFVDAAVTTDEGGSIPANTPTSQVTTNNFGDYNGFGPNTSSNSELPSGTMIYEFGDKTLTFSNVQTPTLAEISASEGRIFPFIKFNKTNSSCTSQCTLASVSYQWMKKTEDGWTEATTEELALLVADSTGRISIRVDDDENKGVGVTIPETSVSGDIAWDAANFDLEGVTDAEFEAITTTQLCHLGLSYDDELGMRYFEGIDDASGTCP